jgi:hypothetical protein
MTKILNTLRVTGTGSGQALGVTGGYVSVSESINIGGSTLPSSRLDINGTASTTYVNFLVNNSSVLNAGTVSLNLLGNYSLLFGTQSVSGTWSIYQYSTASNYFAGKIYQNSLYNSGDNLQINGSGYINRLLISGDGAQYGDDSALKIKYIDRLSISLSYAGTMSAGDNITLTVQGGSTTTTIYSYTASATESTSIFSTKIKNLINSNFPSYLWYNNPSYIYAPQGATSGFWTASVSINAPLASYTILPSSGSFVNKAKGSSNANIPSLNLGVDSIGSPFILFQNGSTRDTGSSGDPIISGNVISRFKTIETSGGSMYIWQVGGGQAAIMGAKVANSGVLSGQTLYITSYEAAGAGLTASSGIASMVRIGNNYSTNSTFIATSGNASLTQLTLEPLISQRLTASGITRGLWINGVFSTAETRASSTYSISTLGTPGATISLFSNSIQLNSPYSIVGSSASQAASGIASAINSYSLTNGGYSATSSGGLILVTAPTGSGSGANSYSTSYQGVGTTIATSSFSGGVDAGSASDWRSFDDPSNAGHTVYQSGKLSKNYFAGRTIFGATFGSSSDDTTSLLQVVGTASINNLILSNSISSGGYSVLVRNASSGKIETFTASLTSSIIGGIGTANYIPLFSSTTGLTISNIYQGSSNGTILIGYTSSSSTYNTDTNVLRVRGDVYFDNISNKFNIGGVQLFDNTNSNIALGNGANNGGTAGTNNVALGYGSLMSNQTGIYNVGVGFNTLQTLTAGSYNMAVGANALYNNKGSRNTSVGYQSGYTSTGDGNTFIGNLSGTGMTSGNYNTFIGGSSSWTSSIPSNYVVITDGVGNKKLVIDNTNAARFYGPLIDISGSTGLGGQVLSATSGGFVWATNVAAGIGATGPQGSIGSQGLTGPQGDQGLIGPQGRQGVTGPQGVQGRQGPLPSTSNYFIQGGNSFGTIATLGTNDGAGLQIVTNATNRLVIDTNGYVGIGTNPDSINNLSVIGGLKIDNLTGIDTSMSFFGNTISNIDIASKNYITQGGNNGIYYSRTDGNYGASLASGSTLTHSVISIPYNTGRFVSISYELFAYSTSPTTGAFITRQTTGNFKVFCLYNGTPVIGGHTIITDTTNSYLSGVWSTSSASNIGTASISVHPSLTASIYIYSIVSNSGPATYTSMVSYSMQLLFASV